MSMTSLPAIQKEIIRYGITVYLVLGLVGNMFNCIMFTRHSYRRTPSSVYLLSLSILSIIHLIWTLSPLLCTLNYTDLQTQSIIYCKLRLYGSHTIGLHIRYAVVLACVDRFLITRTNVRIRSLSSVKMARILVCIMVAICLLIALHLPLLMDLRNGVCGMFGTYKLSYAMYQIIVFSIMPPLLMSIFSILTISKVHQRHDLTQVRTTQRDRYLTRMVFAEVIINVFTSIPYGANLLYGALTYSVMNKSTQRLEIESFITFITQFIIYFLGVAPFYLFILISKPFRNEFINFLGNIWKKYVIQRTRIVPLNDRHTTATNNGRTMHHEQ